MKFKRGTFYDWYLSSVEDIYGTCPIQFRPSLHHVLISGRLFLTLAVLPFVFELIVKKTFPPLFSTKKVLLVVFRQAVKPLFSYIRTISSVRAIINFFIYFRTEIPIRLWHSKTFVSKSYFLPFSPQNGWDKPSKFYSWNVGNCVIHS